MLMHFIKKMDWVYKPFGLETRGGFTGQGFY